MISQRSKSLLYKVATVVAAIIVASFGIWAIEDALQEGEGNVQSRMNDRANFVAKCKSVEGIIGGDKCYVNGEVVFNE